MEVTTGYYLWQWIIYHRVKSGDVKKKYIFSVSYCKILILNKCSIIKENIFIKKLHSNSKLFSSTLAVSYYQKLKNLVGRKKTFEKWDIVVILYIKSWINKGPLHCFISEMDETLYITHALTTVDFITIVWAIIITIT